MLLRFRQVRYFVEIVDAGSITRAATQLNLVPTALSLQVKKLEDQFGVTLLERHARGVVPTSAGRDFYDAARRILDMLAETERGLRGQTGAPARLRLGLPPSVAHALGVKALVPAAGDGIEVDLIEGLTSDLTTRLEGGELDFVLGWIALEHPALNVVEVAEEAVVYVSAPGSDMPPGPVDLADAVGPDLITLGSRSLSWNAVRRHAAAIGLRIESERVVESADLVRRMLRNGLGSAILPVSFVAQEQWKGTVQVHALRGDPMTRTLSLAWPKSASWVNDDRAVRRYFANLVAEFYARTAPHSRLLHPLSRRLPTTGTAPGGAEPGAQDRSRSRDADCPGMLDDCGG